MNYKKFFEKAKLAGIDTSSLTYKKESSLSFSLFHREIDSYSISSQSSIKAVGIYNNQLASISTEDVSDGAIDALINGIKEGASLLEKVEKPVIFKGSEKYCKKNMFNKDLPLVSVDEKLAKLHELEEATYKMDKRVSEVQVSFEENDETLEIANSYGLNLKSRSNHFVYVVQVVCKDKDEVKSNYDVFLGNDFSKYNPQEQAKKVVNDVIAKFNGISIPAKTYKCVLNQDTTASLLKAVIGTGFNAENIQKKSSVLVGKLGEKVFSSKVSVEERPLEKNVFFRYFDDEGVATYNKKLIDKGVVSNFLYNIEAAGRENKESTGNGYNGSIGVRNIYLKPGKKTEEELFASVENGVYITSVAGLHSGLNANSGDFSLEAEGFVIENGKKSSPLKLLTIGGNLYDLFNQVSEVGSNIELKLNEVTCPSIVVKKLKISSL